MAQQVKVLAVELDSLSSIPGTYQVILTKRGLGTGHRGDRYLEYCTPCVKDPCVSPTLPLQNSMPFHP